MSANSRDPEQTGSEDVPSNVELGERVARIEETTEHIDESIDDLADRFDDVADAIDEDLDEIEETQEALNKRTVKMWTGYQIVRWGAGILASVGSLAWLSTHVGT